MWQPAALPRRPMIIGTQTQITAASWRDIRENMAKAIGDN